MIRLALITLATLTLAACEHVNWLPPDEPCDPRTDTQQCEHERKVEPLCPLDPKSCEDLRRENPDPWENN